MGPPIRSILIPVLEGVALLPVTAGAAYVGASIAGGASAPTHWWALLATGSVGLVAGWYAVLRRAELSRRGARVVAIGVLSGVLTVAVLLALTVVPILSGTTSPDATDLVALLVVVYGAPVLVAIAEWPRIRHGLHG